MTRHRRGSYNLGNHFNDYYARRKDFLLECIHGYIADHRYSPSLRNLQTLTGWGSPTLQRYLRRLEEEGLIRRERKRWRSMRLVK